MFILRLFRLAIFMLFAFVAGIFFERSHQVKLCETSGGIWLQSGICGER